MMTETVQLVVIFVMFCLILVAMVVFVSTKLK